RRPNPSSRLPSRSAGPSRRSHFRGMPPHTFRGQGPAANSRRPSSRPNSCRRCAASARLAARVPRAATGGSPQHPDELAPLIKKMDPETPVESIAWVSSSRVGRRPVRNSLDHLVGAANERERNGDAECPGRLEVDDQLDFGGLLDRQLGRFLALENFSSVDADQTVIVRLARSVAQQATSRGEAAILEDRGNRVADRQRGELFASDCEECTGANDQRVGSYLAQGCKRRIEIAFGAGMQRLELEPEGASRRLQVARKGFGKRGTGRVDEQGKNGRRGQQFVQQFEPFRPDLGVQIGHAGQVAAGSVQAGDKSNLYRVSRYPEDDRNGRG